MRVLFLFSILVFTASQAFAATSAKPRIEAHPAAKLYGDASRGERIVDRWCVSCHASGPTLNDQIPPFPVLARDLQRSESAIRTFLMRPHKPMPPLELSSQQVEDIIAFLHTVPAASEPTK